MVNQSLTLASLTMAFVWLQCGRKDKDTESHQTYVYFNEEAELPHNTPSVCVLSGVITAERQEPCLWIPTMPCLRWHSILAETPLEIQSLSQRLALAVAAVFSKQVQI